MNPDPHTHSNAPVGTVPQRRARIA